MMSQNVPNDIYFEQQKLKYYQTLTNDELINKVKDYAAVVNELEGSNLYKIISKDCKEKEEFIDANWYTITDEKVLNNLRIKKTAIRYLLGLAQEYITDLKFAQQRLAERENIDDSIPKDYDIGD